MQSSLEAFEAIVQKDGFCDSWMSDQLVDFYRKAQMYSCAIAYEQMWLKHTANAGELARVYYYLGADNFFVNNKKLAYEYLDKSLATVTELARTNKEQFYEQDFCFAWEALGTQIDLLEHSERSAELAAYLDKWINQIDRLVPSSLLSLGLHSKKDRWLSSQDSSTVEAIKLEESLAVQLKSRALLDRLSFWSRVAALKLETDMPLQV